MTINPILINIPEKIETSNLILQIPKAGDGAELHKAISDGYEDYVKWLAWPSTLPTAEAVEIECRNHRAEFILRSCIRFIITEKKSGTIIGRCAFPPLQVMWSIPQFGISYFIRRSARRHGYATEAAHALSVLAFRVLEARKVEIYCDAENETSQKIPHRLGYFLECTKKGGWPRTDNKLADIQTYAIFSQDQLPKWPVRW